MCFFLKPGNEGVVMSERAKDVCFSWPFGQEKVPGIPGSKHHGILVFTSSATHVMSQFQMPLFYFQIIISFICIEIL